ncbi:bacteriocin biosynthesis cyclodehydratase domain [Actinomyces bovis]|uniref:Bacteriocin biosynthesis cyclodehydratase domain n=1 Tax=Actinomyces bovis TaxID=1658 RepID=A0ABY1VKY0_9ACTO|nr:hypothetical protein [Actinomyces bovis]SPT52758.1 bacteriocin biosynthesis cyclodehydratase domain [Actinomyces bovis]VEG54761.1 bacteriocin biosynthesis cyclodehydratase domain [Actinomyces israelii]
MHLRAGAPVLWREPGVTQIGSTPGRAVVLSNLQPRDQLLLEQLSYSAKPIDLMAMASRFGLPRKEAKRLAQALISGGVLAPDQVPTPVNADEVYWDGLVFDARARSRRLARAIVGVLGSAARTQASLLRSAEPQPPMLTLAPTALPEAKPGQPDPLVLSLACHLATAGVGTVLVHRDRATSQALRQRHPALVQHAPLDTRPDLTVSLSIGATDLVQERRLLQEDLPHLLVTVRETGLELGPVVVPGQTPCGMCLEQWRQEADPSWPELTLQLQASPRPAVESLLAEQAAALAARMVLDALTGRGKAWWGTSVELTAVDPLGLERRWEPHPDCGCLAASANRHAGEA